MKEWLEEKDLPRDCASCRYYSMNCADGYSCSKLNGREVHCNFSEGMGYRHQDCPLQSITDYTKQVRKEVVQEIMRLSAIDVVNKQYIIEAEILDQISTTE